MLEDRFKGGIQLELLGGFNLGGPFASKTTALGRKAAGLLAILAVSSGGSLSRDRIAGLLWSGRDDTLARNSLRQTLTVLRRALGPSVDDALEFGRIAIGLRGGSLRCDVLEFTERIRGGQLAEAVDLYRGPFLDGFFIRDSSFEEWSAGERRRLHDIYVEALEVLVEQETGRGRAVLARRLVAADPLRESAHQLLIEALAKAGARDEALRQFRELQDLYDRELGVGVSAETLALMRAVERPAIGSPAMPPKLDETAPPSPILAVHPFACLSDDREKQLFATSLSSSLVTTLSKLPYLRVVASGPGAMAGKLHDGPAAPDRASTAGFLLDGHLMAADGRARVNVHLVDRKAGEYLFSQRHDVDLNEGFQAQDEIILKVAVAINVALLQGDQALSKLNKANRLAPWELVLQASTLISSHDRACASAARRCIAEAIHLDPSYAAAHTLLGWWHWGQAFCGWSQDPEASVAEALDAAAKGNALDPENPEPHVVMAIALMQRRDFAAAEEALGQAQRLGPNHAMVYAVAANVANFAGRPDAGLRLTGQAMRLCPIYPPWYAGDLSQAHLQLGQLNRSLAWSKAAIDRGARYIHAHLFRVIALQELGRKAEAADAAQTVLNIAPDFVATAWSRGQPFRDPETNRRFLRALLEAGLPAGPFNATPP